MQRMLDKTSAMRSLFNKGKIVDALRNPKQHTDVLFAICVLCIVGVLLFPVPPLLMDFLLSTSIAIAVLILMTVLFLDKPLDLSAFPSILLIVTMLRLSLNVSTTRLILANGHLGTDAAGHVVEAFGYFVTQGSVVIGTIIFGILTIINFVVITKGSGRIAEVAARFSLDAMPGKQMAVDADLSAGLIGEQEARERRKNLEDESTFYGAMDGANKFVRGDAVAGLLITFINFIGGALIGLVQKGMTLEQAMHTYTILTIGDGLVTQIPALLVSISAGLLVTKSGVSGSADKAILEQFGRHPQAIGISAALLFFMAVVMPGIPFVPFTIISGLCAVSAYFIYKAQKQAKLHPVGQGPKSSGEIKAGSDSALLQSLQIDSIKIELGYELLPLLNTTQGQKITDQIKALRKQIAKEMGFLLPSVRIQDNMQIEPKKYIIKIKDVECGSGYIVPSKIMIMDPKGKPLTIPGEGTIEPAFGLPARWVDASAKEEALFKEYTVVDPTTVIITHLTEIAKENIVDLLTYGEVQKLVDNLPAEHKKLVEYIVPSQISLVVLQRVLQGLLSENISVRDLPLILEAISEISTFTSNVSKLIEHVRTRLAKQICHINMSDNGYVPIMILSPQWEQRFIESIVGDGDNRHLVMQPSQLHEFVTAVNKSFENQAAQGEVPVILTSPVLRPFVRSIIERFRPNIVVMSQNEIYPKAKIKTVGQV
ncbi:Flagellar biosynthesis protein FlhA [Alphaproteobacteria bacterium]